MIDAPTVRGGRAGPTLHEHGGRGGRTNGTKRSIVNEILGLPLAVQVDSVKPHDVRSGRELSASWRRWSPCYERSVARARAWLEVALVAYLFVRLQVRPA
jgi:hypothetical protein